MLTKKQWLWVAEHHLEVRVTFVVITILVGALYLGLVIKTGWDKGKAPTPFVPITKFTSTFGCRAKEGPTYMGPFGGNTLSKPGYYKDASGWRFERHETYMYDAQLLFNAPECVGAMMADTSNNPNPFVIILFDTKNNRPLYRIARIDNVLKR